MIVKGLSAMLCCFALHAAAQAQTAWQPEKHVEFVVGSAPGGGNDRTARLLQRAWQDSKLLQNISVINKVGGGGSLAYTHVHQHPNDAHHLVVVRPGFLSNHILGRSPIGPNDMTPLAMVSGERIVIAVRAASPLKSVADIVERLKQDPQSLAFTVGSARGSTPHLMMALLAKQNGIDARKLKVVTFAGGAESVSQLLGGHIDLMAIAIDNAAPHYKSGAMRILGMSTAQRASGMPDIPTLREQGFDIVLSGFTVIMGPRGLTPAQIAYWENMIERGVQHPDWKRQFAADYQDGDFRKSAATREHLRQQYDLLRAMYADIGMTK